MVASTFIPSLLPGLKAKEVIDLKQLTGELYGNLLEELNGAHLRIAATHVRVEYIFSKKIKILFGYMNNNYGYRFHLQ